MGFFDFFKKKKLPEEPMKKLQTAKCNYSEENVEILWERIENYKDDFIKRGVLEL